VYLVILGPPGTGKGTQATVVADKLGLVHISSGDMFREAAQRGTEFGLQAKGYMDRGNLVPDELTIAMLKERIQQPDAQKGAIFDGFPRTEQQAQALDEALGLHDREVARALLITASDDEIIRRLSGRWLCPSCGAIFHQDSRPPKSEGVCDSCGATLRQRDDDRPEIVRERLQRQRPPKSLLDHYGRQHKLKDIHGEQDPEAVTRDILGAVEKQGAY
jgi:adenylate kinase